MSGNVFHNNINDLINKFDADIFRLKEARIFLLRKGTIKYLLNFEEYMLEGYSLVLLSPNSVFKIIEISSDIECEVIAIKDSFFESESMLKVYTQFWLSPFIRKLSEEEFQLVEKYFLLICDVNSLKPDSAQKSALQHLMLSFIFNVKSFAESEIEVDPQSPYKMSIFHRFISLVKEHYKQQRTVGFYADSLSLTPHYLSTLIKQTSGETVMQWINKMVILKAKEMLKEGNLLVYEIADELNFPNPSFFSRFFKKQTGITPFQYQKQNFRDVLSEVRY
ncbi:helix-turn-helix transcriptional regulator [bacterium]|nr:helix-turn-helix transcriptional regulator [bacterium]